MAEEQTEKLELETPLGKIKTEAKSLNSQMTFLVLVASLVGLPSLWMALRAHTDEAKEAQSAFVSAIKEQTAAVKEQTVAAREQNCLIRFPPETRESRAEFCKQISR